MLAAWGASELFAPRAAYIQVGAMLGTIMVANVFFVIIPMHWKLVRAKEAGEEPDPAWNALGKQRSVHNNYLTLPVVFAMLSNHFAFTYGHANAWLILVALMALGAWTRHYFNLRHRGRNAWWILATAAAGMVALAIVIRPSTSSSSTAGPAADASPQCRRSSPTAAPPATPPRRRSPATAPRRPGSCSRRRPRSTSMRPLIKTVAVDSHAMPLGNATGMTQDERDTLARWFGSR